MATTDTLTAAPALTPRAEAAFRAVTIISVALLAIAAAVLSYSGLRDAALRAEINPDLAWIFPLVIDGLTFVGSIGVVYAVLTHTSPWYPWFLTLLGVGISTTGNVAVSPDDPISQMVHAAPPVVLALALEALLRVYRARAQRMLVEAVSEERGRGRGEVDSVVTSPTHRVTPEESAPLEPAATVVPSPIKEPSADPASPPSSTPAPTVAEHAPAPPAPAPEPEPTPEATPVPVEREPAATSAPDPEPVLARGPESIEAPTLVPAPQPTVKREPTPEPGVDPFMIAAPVRSTSSASAATLDVEPEVAKAAPEAKPGVDGLTVDPPLTARDQLPDLLVLEPDISGAEVARRLNIDGSYARRLLREARDDNQDQDDQPSGQEALFSTQSA